MMDEFEEGGLFMNEDDKHAEQVRTLKERFSLKDFMSCYETRYILTEAFQERFEEWLEKELYNLYERVRKDHQEQCTGILAYDRGGIGCGEFINLVWDNLQKDYNLEIFYDEPELAQPLLNSIVEIKEYEAKLEQKEVHKRFNKANRAFDWKNKKYV